MEHLYEKTLTSELLYEGRIFELTHDTVQLEDGSVAHRDVVHHSGGVCVLPLTDDGDVILVRQFRYPFGEVLLEVPAGKINKGEVNPLDCGIRELQEETGACAKKYTDLGVLYPTVAYVTEKIYMYLAEGLEFGERKLDDDEFLDVVKMPLEQAYTMVMNGEIRDSKTQVAILKVREILKNRL